MQANSSHLADSLRGKFADTPTSCLREITNNPATGLYVHHERISLMGSSLRLPVVTQVSIIGLWGNIAESSEL
jgi:hypothetical protein